MSFADIPLGGNKRGAPAKGRHYALIIAVDRYDNFTELATPRNDGEAVAKLLTGKFGFTPTITLADGEERSLLLLDSPTRAEIFEMLLVLAETLGEDDTLLIYFAGHGYQRDRDAPAFWVPSDGKTNRTFSYVSAEGILEQIAADAGKEHPHRLRFLLLGRPVPFHRYLDI